MMQRNAFIRYTNARIQLRANQIEKKTKTRIECEKKKGRWLECVRAHVKEIN